MALEYFALFGIPVSLRVDKAALRKSFFELSRQLHPDYHAQATDAEQADVLEAAASLNKAYKTLGDDDALIAYVLTEKGLMEAEEKYALDPEFLMEMMDLNEAVADAGADPAAREQVGMTLKRWQNEIYEPVAQIVEHYQEGIGSEKELLQVKEYYFRRKYLQRLAGQLGIKL